MVEEFCECLLVFVVGYGGVVCDGGFDVVGMYVCYFDWMFGD